jgi:hypothetical protein
MKLVGIFWLLALIWDLAEFFFFENGSGRVALRVYPFYAIVLYFSSNH